MMCLVRDARCPECTAMVVYGCIGIRFAEGCVSSACLLGNGAQPFPPPPPARPCVPSRHSLPVGMRPGHKETPTARGPSCEAPNNGTGICVHLVNPMTRFPVQPLTLT